MRHLHHRATDTPRALCGVHDRKTVPASKARRSDCPTCRMIHRAHTTAGRVLRRRAAAQVDAILEAKPEPRPQVETIHRLKTGINPLPPTAAGPFPDKRTRLYWALWDAAEQLTTLGEHLCDLEGEVRRAFWSSHPAPQLPGEGPAVPRMVGFPCGHRAPLDPARPDWCDRCEQLTLDNENREEDEA